MWVKNVAGHINCRRASRGGWTPETTALLWKLEPEVAGGWERVPAEPTPLPWEAGGRSGFTEHRHDSRWNNSPWREPLAAAGLGCCPQKTGKADPCRSLGVMAATVLPATAPCILPERSPFPIYGGEILLQTADMLLSSAPFAVSL